ncbi:MAG: ester cyclase [Pseudomonadota bacterium]
MTKLRLIVVALAFAVISPVAFAGDKDVVKAFYTDLLSEPNAPDLEERVSKVMIDKWVSIPTPRGGPDAAGFVKSLKGFGAAIPDLKWEIQEILQDENRYIVRSIATGTPVKPMFGVEPKGNSFKIMTIDIHTVENGKIVQSYHVEEWAKAIQQLSAN